MSQVSQYLKTLKWALSGRPLPPPHLVKQQMLLEVARRFELEVLVETGTFLGDMVEATRKHFQHVYSVEISDALAKRAQQRFANTNNVTIFNGDSTHVLRTLIPTLKVPALFWLDGHYSGGQTGKGATDTPIRDELATVFSSELTHVILIDDARCFGTEADYPTLSELETLISKHRPNTQFFVKNDAIHVLPPPMVK